MIVKLSKPTILDDVEYTEINLKLETLKGKDLIELESGFRRLYNKEYIPMVNIDSRYQIMVAGRVCGINPITLGELEAPDFVEICSTVQSFLLK